MAVKRIMKATERAGDSAALEGNLSRALGALRRLHKAGIERSREILEENENRPYFLPLALSAGADRKVEFKGKAGLRIARWLLP